MQEVLGEWKEAFKKHELEMSMEKNEVMWVGQQKTKNEYQVRGEGDQAGK